MTDRVELLGRFGAVPDWMAERVWSMDQATWRKVLDAIEAGDLVMPVTIEDTMPRNRNGFIQNPHSEPQQYRAEELAKWTAWSAVWGPAPWEHMAMAKGKPRLGKRWD